MAMKYEQLRATFYAPQFNAFAYANQNSVLTGCEVTESSPVGMTVEVDSGRVFFETNTLNVTGGSLSISNNTTSFTRIDMVAVNTAGAISVLQGTPSALPKPADYDPNSYIILALVFVTSNIDEITNTQIKDNRLLNIGGGGSSSAMFARATKDFTSTTSVEFQHNLGDLNPFVFVYNSSGELIEPATVTADDINTITVTFSVSTTGKIIVFGGKAINNGYYKKEFSLQTSVSVPHNLNNKYVDVTVFDNTDKIITPQSVTMVDENNCTVAFATTVTGTVIVTGGSAYFTVANSDLTGLNISELNNDANYITTAGTKGAVVHGAVASTARPSGYSSVEWIGSVEPDNATENDTWIDTN